MRVDSPGVPRRVQAASPGSLPSAASPAESLKASPAAKYERLESNIGEGTYGKVHKALHTKSAQVVAIKKAKVSAVDADIGGVGFTALREIKVMKAVCHPNVMGCLDVFAERGILHLVMEFMDGDLKKVIEDKALALSEAHCKCLAKQLLQGLGALHERFFVHRDVTPNNVLLNFQSGVAKLSDFGFTRIIGQDDDRPMTAACTTLWYRAPELFFGAKQYGQAVDIWSSGCIVAEMLMREAMFPGRGEFGMLQKIIERRGTPSEEVWKDVSSLPNFVEFTPHPKAQMEQILPNTSTASQAFVDLLLTLDPKQRPTAAGALAHDALKMVDSWRKILQCARLAVEVRIQKASFAGHLSSSNLNCIYIGPGTEQRSSQRKVNFNCGLCSLDVWHRVATRRARRNNVQRLTGSTGEGRFTPASLCTAVLIPSLALQSAIVHDFVCINLFEARRAEDIIQAKAGKQSRLLDVLKRQPPVKDTVVIESDEDGPASPRQAQILTTPKAKEAKLADSRPTSKDASPMAESSSPEEPTRKRSRITTKTSEKTVEQIYQKKTQLEHILLRPDSYVGSVERQQQELWTLSGGSSSSAQRMVRRKVDYVPALYKIFDEILVNAADNLIRDPSMNTIKVEISATQSRISVWNNGRGLPVQVHKEHRCYVPTLVFGHLLTSDNYDDSEKKVVGGRNGYGAKLTNIYSKSFVVETADTSSHRKYRQQWSDNMRCTEEPEIVPYKGKDFTSVTFEPDLRRFGMTHLEDDIVALMQRRAYDVAASTRGRCEVYLNGQCLEVDSFEDYVSLFLDPDDFRISEACNDRWEVAIALTDGSGFRQVSFVNSICTSRGGTHVNCVADQVVSAVMDELAKEKANKAGNLAVKPQHVRNHLWVFVNCLIENPAFDSQTKETLTTKRERFGSTCELSEVLLQAVCTSGIVETLQEWSKALGKSELARHLNKSVTLAVLVLRCSLDSTCLEVSISILACTQEGGRANRVESPVFASGGGGNNANNIRMGVPGMMMGMGQGMRMPMGMPMMGMPMMGMMGMPMNPMMAMPMNPMMGMGMNAGMGAQSPQSGQGADRSAGVNPPSTAVVPPKVDTQPSLESKGLPPGLPPGVVHRERSRSRDVVRAPPKAEKEPEPAREPTPPREKTPPRCHLHNTKKPNAKCKFCQKWLASQSQAHPESDKAHCADKDGGKHKEDKSKHKEVEKALPRVEEDEEDYSRRTFKCSSLLKDQIFGSSYFKSLLDISDLDPLTEEIAKYADTLDVYNSGNNVHPSCFICQVYRLFTLPQSEDLDELLAVLDANPSAKVRCAAFLYVRFVVPPNKLYDKLEENLFDDQELKYVDGDKQVTTTIREYVENLMIKDRYYNTPLPRIPVKVRQHLEKELAPLSQFRKRMAAVQRELPPKKVAGTAVEVYIDGSWLPGHIKNYVGQHKRKVSIQLEDGTMVQSHLGKVVLRDEEVDDKDKEKDKDNDKDEKDEALVDEKKEGDDEEKTKDEDHDQKKKKKDKKDDRDSSRSRSRSRSRHRSRSRSRRRRGSSPDWARYKGSMDPSEIERLREKAREEAVVGVGKAYSKRPTTVEGEMWRGSGSEGRVSMLGSRDGYGSARSSGAKGSSDTEIRSRISREEEEEHKRRMREIYEKYGSVSKATSGNTGTQRTSEIDQPDVLRLG
ncbi:Top2 [Symbiodinium natans]|uniref:DNA topoisomerase 2 n=1 Tax=Symbiodinium natans TaxID=878477 RepID=A0A812NBX6_9DINO|nr:Top2 [Symbiodinium natans]